MAKACGKCGSRSTCGCTLVNGEDVYIFGDGNRIAPFSVYIQNYPRPRPQAWLEGNFTSNQGESLFIADSNISTKESVPGMIIGSSTVQAPINGTYLISFGSQFGFNANPTRGEYRLKLNNSTIIAGFEYTWGQDEPDGPSASKTIVYYLSAGNFVNMLVQHQLTSFVQNGFITMKWMGF